MVENIAGKSCEAVKVVVKKYTVYVVATLEIRLYWAGKGTINYPSRGLYGPHISAILSIQGSSPPVSAPVVTPNVKVYEQNGLASSPFLAISKAEPSSDGI
ncbi:Concanavalin A-like lectin/glucanase, subgroup [Artemisia annua]|uniref:Concanavalin A-like lectin/glucanase, subgroup n=1 Tax=Artemisia annua TaxID=35608 RepID=A0A2U1L0T4_ARTAN|nr:Concanavalin A-like lectin/glucanase, subgroup [Artemisia annua]